MDRSSVSISPSNPYDPQTPTKPRTPINQTTPTSLVRNLFARSRPTPSPLQTPRPDITSPRNTVVLSPSKRSLKRLSSSPEEDREVTPTPSRPKRPRRKVDDDVKPKIEPIDGSLAPLHEPPARQVAFRDSVSSGEVDKPPSLINGHPQTSPTLRNQSPTPGETSTSQRLTSQEGQLTGSQQRPRKRVRMASPESELAPSIPSQPVPSSGETLISTQTNTSATGSTRSNLSKTSWQFRSAPPLPRDITFSVDPEVVYTEPYYSNPVDVPPRAKMFAGRMFTLKGNSVADLTDFVSTIVPDRAWLKTRKVAMERAKYGWEYAPIPPKRMDVVKWCQEEDEKILVEGESPLGARRQCTVKRKARLTSQLAGPTQKNRYGFKFSQKTKTKESEREHQNMSVLAIEVFGGSFGVGLG